MRAMRFLSTAILLGLMSASAAVYAQEEKREEAKPPRQEQQRPEERREQMQAPRQEEARPDKQDKQERKEQKQEEKQSRQMERQHNEAAPAAQGGAHARPAGKSAHIPDEKFRSQFGRSHTFVVQRPVVVQGQPGFVYGGYSFVFVDPWPMDWAYTDDCYVDYIDGEYFLFDMFHPGVRIALFVVM